MGKETRLFHIGDILSITTKPKVLVSPDGIDGVFRILNFMTGDTLYSHQLSRAANECKPYLLEEHPWLHEIDSSTVDENTWRSWLEQQVEQYGEQHSVRPIHPEDHDRKYALQELREMRPDADIIELRPDEPDEPPLFGDISWINLN